MNDKDLLEDILLTVKGAADLYLHATIEASTSNVKTAFHENLHEVLKCQGDIYNKMAQKTMEEMRLYLCGEFVTIKK